jgi:phosphoglycerate dehydrogenase-like enzyme
MQTPAEVLDHPCDLAAIDVLVGSPITPGMIAASPRLQLIHASGAGLDAVARWAIPPGVLLCNVFHHERAMAEYVVMTMLALSRKLFQQDSALRKGRWDGSCVTGLPAVSELRGKKLGVIGLGHIGSEAANLLRPFETEVQGLRSRHSRSELESLLADSDFVLIACPLTDQTRGMIGARELELMKPSAYLINVARGEIVDEQALYQALSNRSIAGAAIDVWYHYPRDGNSVAPSTAPFHLLDNIIMTPHSSGWTDYVLEARFRDIAANIDRLARGEPLVNVIS